MFVKNRSTKQLVLVVIIVALTAGISAVTDWDWLYYLMAFLIYLTTFIDDKPSKKENAFNVLGLVGLVAIVFIGNSLL